MHAVSHMQLQTSSSMMSMEHHWIIHLFWPAHHRQTRQAHFIIIFYYQHTTERSGWWIKWSIFVMIETWLYGNFSILKDLEMLTNLKHVVALLVICKTTLISNQIWLPGLMLVGRASQKTHCIPMGKNNVNDFPPCSLIRMTLIAEVSEEKSKEASPLIVYHAPLCRCCRFTSIFLVLWLIYRIFSLKLK